MKQEEIFIQALVEWERKRPFKVQDFKALVIWLNHIIGVEEDDKLETLRARIKYLVNTEKINMDLLITGLVLKTKELLEKNIAEHGNLIILHEKLLEEGLVEELSREKLEKLKQPDYQKKSLLELKLWKEESMDLLDYFNREAWKTKRFLKREKKYEDIIKNLPKKLRETLWEIPIDQLRKIPLEELKELSRKNN